MSAELLFIQILGGAVVLSAVVFAVTAMRLGNPTVRRVNTIALAVLALGLVTALIAFVLIVSSDDPRWRF